jgi:hypothetical protein
MAKKELTASATRAAASTRSASICSPLAGWRASLPVRKYDKGQYPRASDADYMKVSLREQWDFRFVPWPDRATTGFINGL